MTDRRQPWDRLVELAVYAPVGLVTSLHEELPRYIRQGREAVEHRVVLARWIGQMAVAQGRRELAKRMPGGQPAGAPVETTAREGVTRDDPLADVAAAPDVLDDLDDADDADAVDAVDLEPEVVGGPPDPGPPDASGLPIEGYESLAALHVVQRLAGLSAAELDLVRQFEEANRGRRTILAKVAQLQGDRA